MLFLYRVSKDLNLKLISFIFRSNCGSSWIYTSLLHVDMFDGKYKIIVHATFQQNRGINYTVRYEKIGAIYFGIEIKLVNKVFLQSNRRNNRSENTIFLLTFRIFLILLHNYISLSNEGMSFANFSRHSLIVH